MGQTSSETNIRLVITQDKKQLNCEELGTNIKFDKHQVGQTLTGTKIELEKIKWENIKWDKHQVRQTLNNGWDKH